jgi:hypothetical protein
MVFCMGARSTALMTFFTGRATLFVAPATALMEWHTSGE